MNAHCQSLRTTEVERKLTSYVYIVFINLAYLPQESLGKVGSIHFSQADIGVQYCLHNTREKCPDYILIRRFNAHLSPVALQYNVGKVR